MYPICSVSRRWPKIVIAVLLIFGLAGLSSAGFSSTRNSFSTCLSTDWPSELSRLAPDPSLVRGKLKNGFRYVIKRNEEPKNRVAIYLDVQAGSLNERDDQRGLAHFLEHMMFNGSTHFPPGTLVDYFQSIGMNFGGDTNAHTTHNETVYHLILPNGSEKDLESGFVVMADFARGALLLDTEIDRERGVILAEKRARDSAEYRTQIAGTTFALHGTRYPERMPIGLEQTIKNAGHDLLKSYYDAWYRPDNMILVVVGDTDPKLAANLIERQFAKLSSVGQKPQCPDFGKLTNRGPRAFYHYEPELGETNVAIQTFWDQPLQNDSAALEKKDLLRMIGSMVVGYRLQRLQEEDKVPFTHAGYYSGDIVNRIGFGALSARADAEHWQETLTCLDKVLRQAILYGFTKNEVERAKKEILAQLNTRVLTAGSEDSRTIARAIIDHLNNNRVYQSAEQEKTFYGPLTEGINPAAVNGAFRERWRDSNRLVSVMGDVQLGKGGTAAIASAYRDSQRQPVVASVGDNTPILPALQPSSSGDSHPQQSYFKDIGVERLIFPNGLIINLKKTQFEENRIRVRADFGAGKENERVPGTAMLVEGIVNGSGSGKLLQSSIDQLIAGSSIQMSFSVDESSFAWTGTTLTKDFELFCKVLHTLLLDPGFRKNIFTRVKENTGLMYQKISQEIEGAIPLSIEPFLATYNGHFGLPAWKNIAGLNFDSLAQWTHSLIKPGDLEISVVGDFNRDDVVAVLGKYFSTIELSSAKMPAAQSVVFPAGKELDDKVDTSVEKSLIVVAWPTEDFWNIHRTRRLHLLADVFGDRLRKIIREKLAASYSPNVASFTSRVYPGYGYLIAQMLVKPGSEDAVVAQILKISDQLRRGGITSDELVRAKGPMLTSLRENIRTNEYWLNSVLSLSARYPQLLTWPKTIVSDYSSISEKEINDLAARYLVNTNAAIAKVTPEIKKKNENAVVIGDKNVLKPALTN